MTLYPTQLITSSCDNAIGVPADRAEMASQDVLPDLFSGSVNIKWKEGAPAPIARAQGCAVLFNKAVYVGGGFTSGDDQENVRAIDIYDPDTDKWNTIDTPHALFAMTVLMNKLLVVGGMTNDGEVTNKVLTLENNQWKDYTEMPTARCMHAAVSHKSTMIVMGGQVGLTTLNTTELLDGATDQWSKCDDLPKPLSFLQSVIVNDMVYILGGVTLVLGENSPKSVYGAPVQNLSSNQLKWQHLVDTPNSLLAAVSLRSKYLLTLGGGQEDNSPEMKLFNEVFTFNPSSSSWIPTSTLPLHVASAAVASSNDSRLVVIGGVIKVDEKDDATNKVWIGQFQ